MSPRSPLLMGLSSPVFVQDSGGGGGARRPNAAEQATAAEAERVAAEQAAAAEAERVAAEQATAAEAERVAAEQAVAAEAERVAAEQAAAAEAERVAAEQAAAAEAERVTFERAAPASKNVMTPSFEAAVAAVRKPARQRRGPPADGKPEKRVDMILTTSKLSDVQGRRLRRGCVVAVPERRIESLTRQDRVRAGSSEALEIAERRHGKFDLA